MAGHERWVYAGQAVGQGREKLRPYRGLRWLDTEDAVWELGWACERGEVRSRCRDASGEIKSVTEETWHPRSLNWVYNTLHSAPSRPCKDFGDCATRCFHEVQINHQDLIKWIQRAKKADAIVTELLGPEGPKLASTRRIHETIRDVNDSAASKGEPAPNINRLSAEVQARLAQTGFRASVRKIREAAKAPEHALRRRPRGKTLASERRSKPK